MATVPEIEPFIVDVLGTQTSLSSDEPHLMQILGAKIINDKFMVRASDSQFHVKCYFSPEIDQDRIGQGDVILVKRFMLNVKSTIVMLIKEWELVQTSVPVQGPPQQLHLETLNQAVSARSGNSTNGNGTNGDANGSASLATTKAKQTAKAMGATHCTVEALSPWFSGNWQLQVRATKKSEIREYTSKATNSTGKVFNITFTDETGDIIATGFSDFMVTKFYDEIVEGQQYYISKLEVKPTDKRYNRTGNDYELQFTRDTIVNPVTDRSVQLPSVFFKFVKDIASLAKVDVDSNVDVIGVATEVGDVQSLTSKSQIAYTKRDIQLSDDSERTITLTLWGAEADNFNHELGTVIAVKGVRLSDFRGLSLSATRGARLFAEPDHQRAHQLKGWYQASGGAGNIQFAKVVDDSGPQTNGERKENPSYTIAGVNEHRIGLKQGTTEYFQLRARIAIINQRVLTYPACNTDKNCRKKVVQDGSEWDCVKCEQSMDEPKYRYLLNMGLSDVSSANPLNVSIFDEVGLQLYGDRAAEFQRMKSDGGDGFNKDLANALNVIRGNEYIWNIRATLDQYNGEERPRFSVNSIKKIDGLNDSLRTLSEMGY